MEDIQFLDDRLYEFNMAATGIRSGELLVAVVDGYPTPHRRWYLKKAII